MKKFFLIFLIVCCVSCVGCDKEKDIENSKTDNMDEIDIDYYWNLLYEMRYDRVEDFIYDISTEYSDYFKAKYIRETKRMDPFGTLGLLDRELSEEQKELFEKNIFDELGSNTRENVVDSFKELIYTCKENGVYIPQINDVNIKFQYVYPEFNSGIFTTKCNTITYKLDGDDDSGYFDRIKIAYLDEKTKMDTIDSFINDAETECKYYIRDIKLKNRTVKAIITATAERYTGKYWFVFIYDDVLIGVVYSSCNKVLVDMNWIRKLDFDVIEVEKQKN